MRRFPKLLPHLLRLTLAGTFLAAGGGDAFGAHECPHHDNPFGHSAAEASHAAGEHQPDAGVGSHAGPTHEDPSQHGPCTCVGDCQGGTATPLSTVDVPSVDLAPATVANHGFSSESRPLGPRVRRYQLHLPNAPPTTL